ncbi:MAG: hypothetical protein AAF990_05860 [Bacteroidota bacterium]
MTPYNALSADSRVWIYQSSRPFNQDELAVLKEQINRFTTEWVSHNRQLKAFGDVYYQQFIVLMVDEGPANASGCSIDSSVHFVKELEQLYAVNLFDRMTFVYQKGEDLHFVPQEEFSRLYENGQIDDETSVFDNLVKTKGDFESQWIKPLGKSWHKRMVPELPV